MENPYREGENIEAIRQPPELAVFLGASALALLGGVALLSLACIVDAALLSGGVYGEGWAGLLPVVLFLVLACWVWWRDRGLSKAARPKAKGVKEARLPPDLQEPEEPPPEDMGKRLRSDAPILLLLGWSLVVRLDGFFRPGLPATEDVAIAMARDGALFAAVAAAAPVSLLGGWLLLRWLGGLPLPRPR